MYLWLGVFSLQPHKEERFMFVAYQAICVNSATTIHQSLQLLDWAQRRWDFTRPFVKWGKFCILFVLPLTAILSLSRALAIVTAYSAPMHIYSSLEPSATGNLCLGKEWYRFPSSYFLPDGVRTKFIKSA